MTLADRANDQLRSRYAKGAATYTSYLTQLKSSQQQRLALAQQRLVLLQDRIALHRAIAGAWELSAPDTTPGRVEHFLIDRAADRADQSTDVNELR